MIDYDFDVFRSCFLVIEPTVHIATALIYFPLIPNLLPTITKMVYCMLLSCNNQYFQNSYSFIHILSLGNILIKNNVFTQSSLKIFYEWPSIVCMSLSF